MAVVVQRENEDIVVVEVEIMWDLVKVKEGSTKHKRRMESRWVCSEGIWICILGELLLNHNGLETAKEKFTNNLWVWRVEPVAASSKSEREEAWWFELKMMLTATRSYKATHSMRGVITIAQLCQECLRCADCTRRHCSAAHALYTNEHASPDQSVERSHINCSSG